MNIDEGRRALEVADETFPIKYWKEVLYVGICPHTFREWRGDFFLKYLRGAGAVFKCTIVEKYKLYADDVENTKIFKRFNIEVICSDIIQYVKNCDKRFDAIIWWHGPEHVSLDELKFVIKEFDNICSGIIVMGCPDGKSPGQKKYNDVKSGDTHKISLSMEHFEGWGYKAWLEDRRWKKRGPSITAIKSNL